MTLSPQQPPGIAAQRVRRPRPQCRTGVGIRRFDCIHVNCLHGITEGFTARPERNGVK